MSLGERPQSESMRTCLPSCAPIIPLSYLASLCQPVGIAWQGHTRTLSLGKGLQGSAAKSYSLCIYLTYQNNLAGLKLFFVLVFNTGFLCVALTVLELCV